MAGAARPDVILLGHAPIYWTTCLTISVDQQISQQRKLLLAKSRYSLEDCPCIRGEFAGCGTASDHETVP